MDFEDFQDDIQAGPAEEGEEGEGMAQEQPLEQPKPKPKRAIKKRPKLTLEQLQAPNGLQEVFEKFPKWFQEGYRGKGHEVSDLRRLLELYQRWHPRLFNFCDYNQFESTLEKMSGTHPLKVKLQDMRSKLPELVDPKPPEQEQQADTGTQQQQQHDQQQAGSSQQQQHDQQQQHAGGLGDIDDDELLEMQAAPMDQQVMDELLDGWDLPQPAVTAPVRPSPAAATDAISRPAEQPASSAGGSPAAAGASQQQPRAVTAKRSMRDWSDDDDDDDDAGGLQPPSKQQQHRQRLSTPSNGSGGSREAAAAAAAAPSDDLEDGDVDLEPPAAAAAQAGRARLRKRQVLQDADSDDFAAAAAEDLEDEVEGLGGSSLQETGAVVETQAEGAGAGMVRLDSGELQGGSGQPGMKLQIGTEFEGSARHAFVLQDDDEDDG